MLGRKGRGRQDLARRRQGLSDNAALADVIKKFALKSALLILALGPSAVRRRPCALPAVLAPAAERSPVSPSKAAAGA